MCASSAVFAVHPPRCVIYNMNLKHTHSVPPNLSCCGDSFQNMNASSSNARVLFAGKDAMLHAVTNSFTIDDSGKCDLGSENTSSHSKT